MKMDTLFVDYVEESWDFNCTTCKKEKECYERYSSCKDFRESEGSGLDLKTKS